MSKRPERRNTINDNDRSRWVDNDEGLYDLWRSSRKPKAAWVKENRAMIDEVIRNVISGKRRPDYFKYGG